MLPILKIFLYIAKEIDILSFHYVEVLNHKTSV